MLLYCTKLWNTDSRFYSCVVTKLMNSNSYFITAYSIPCNTDSYYSVITITVYQTCPEKKKKTRCRVRRNMNISPNDKNSIVLG